MAVSPMVMGKVGGDGVFLEWKGRNSVLESLSFSPLSGIQRQMSEIQASSFIRACCWDVGQVGLSQARYSWVSSA